MATIDYGKGDVDFRCTAWTCLIYEQEFHDDENEKITGDLIADVIGKVIVSSNDVLTVDEDGAFVTTVIDYTRVNWNATLRALWAMLKTESDITGSRSVPSYSEWSRSLLECEPDMQEMHALVAEELQRGLFRAGAAASGKTSEQE